MVWACDEKIGGLCRKQGDGNRSAGEGDCVRAGRRDCHGPHIHVGER